MAVAGSRHCSERGCGQLDFLPFTCEKCGRVYCLAHHKIRDHSCSYNPDSRNVMPTCPVCSQHIYVPAEASVDAIVNAHLLSRCNSHLLSSHRDAQKSLSAAATRCDQPTGCRNPEKFSTLLCKKCGGQFCLTHRLETTHRCTGVANNSLSSASSHAHHPGAAEADTKNAKGKALLASLKAKREAKEAAQLSHDRAHAAQFPTASSSSSSAASGAPSSQQRPYTTLQQIRAGINAAGSAAASAIASVMPASAAASPSPSPQPASAAASSSDAAAAAVPRAVNRSPPAALTLAAKRAAIGDASLPDTVAGRRYLVVDVTAIKSKRAPALCFFAPKHTCGKILDQICEAASIENENHLPAGKKLYLNCPRMGATFPGELTLASMEGILLDGDMVTLTRQPLSQPAS